MCKQGVTNFDVKRLSDIVEQGGVNVEANQVCKRIKNSDALCVMPSQSMFMHAVHVHEVIPCRCGFVL